MIQSSLSLSLSLSALRSVVWSGASINKHHLSLSLSLSSMEEPKAPEAAPPPPPPPQLSNPPPPPPTTTTPQTQTPLPPTTKKRPLDSDSHSRYFKIRAVIRDLRPHFLQVLQTPDYKNCKASHEIREQLKIVMKLYDDMRADAGKSKNVQDDKNLDHKTQQEQQHLHVKSSEQSQVEKAFARSSETKLTPSEQSQEHGTYRVGGSVFGWNFITFSGKDPVYYGRTKEQFRSAKATE